MLSGTPETKSPNRIAYEAHVVNVRALQKAVTVAERAHKRAIRDGPKDEEELTLLFLFTLTGIWCENVLRRVVFTKGMLNDTARTAVLRTSGGYSTKQRERWSALVDQTLFARYNVRKFSALHQHVQVWRKRLTDAVVAHVVPVIEDRNRLAHGGWVVHLDGDAPHLSPSPLLGDYLAIRRRREIILLVSNLILDILSTNRSGEDSLKNRMSAGIERLADMERTLEDHDLGEQRARLQSRVQT